MRPVSMITFFSYVKLVNPLHVDSAIEILTDTTEHNDEECERQKYAYKRYDRQQNKYDHANNT